MNSKAEHRTSNKEYLELSHRQYSVFQKLMTTKMNQWPRWLKDAMQVHANEPVSGDALACWVAEAVKNIK